MVSIKHIAISLYILSMLTACATRPVYDKKPDNQDIYAPIKDGVIEYRHESDRPTADRQTSSAAVINQPQADQPSIDDQGGDTTRNTDFIEEQIKQVRHLFFARNYDQASQLAERLIRQAPNNPAAYYWLARIKLETADYQQAYQMTEKGISVSEKNSQVRKALQRLNEQAAVGAN